MSVGYRRHRRTVMQERRAIEPARGSRRRRVLGEVLIELYRMDAGDHSWKRHRDSQWKPIASHE